MTKCKIMISAGEASGDLYAAQLMESLRARRPGVDFFGCAGPHMQAAGMRTVVDSRNLSVVGLLEVVSHIPRIYGEYRRLLDAARREKPQLAILTDSPDFHLRVAKKLRRMGIPVVYLVAPQVWAWRQHRSRAMRRDLSCLLCIFPFEEKWFRERGVPASYIGHPLSRTPAPRLTREQFLRKHRLPTDRATIVLLPGSRLGEARRHLPDLVDAVNELNRRRAMNFILAAPAGAGFNDPSFREPFSGSSIQLIEGETREAIAHADLALAASGTVTVETALLGTPMVTFYKVTPVSWWLGKLLVDVPFYSMVNLVAQRQVVPEIMQNEITGRRLADEAWRLLEEHPAREKMRRDLAEVAATLSAEDDPIAKASAVVERMLEDQVSC